MEYHSFLLNKKLTLLKLSLESFRLLMEYHSFLQKIKYDTITVSQGEFPSPYGVSFILTALITPPKHVAESKRVSVSLWSIIHSYINKDSTVAYSIMKSFRLLMEYHSFLLLREIIL